MDDRFHYWFPSRVLHFNFPGWTVLVPFMWPLLALTFVLWVFAVAAWFVISLPVNLVRSVIYVAHHA